MLLLTVLLITVASGARADGGADGVLPNESSNFHGFMSSPPSRAKLCQLRVNRDCGGIIYEPQSIEGHKGFPDSPRSPADGQIASANNERFSKLNEYGKDRWTSVDFPTLSRYDDSSVYFNFNWTMTAPHSTDSIRVFVSNEHYNTEEPLSRKHLDLNPICKVDFHGQRPPRDLSLACPITEEKFEELKGLRELLMLSIWDINDTVNAFYQVVDLLPIPESVTFDSIQRRSKDVADVV
nr:glcNAc-binding protein A-like [Megalopta genalis]